MNRLDRIIERIDERLARIDKRLNTHIVFLVFYWVTLMAAIIGLYFKD